MAIEADARHADIIVLELRLKKSSNAVVMPGMRRTSADVGEALSARRCRRTSTARIADCASEQRTSQRTRHTSASVETHRTLSGRRPTLGAAHGEATALQLRDGVQRLRSRWLPSYEKIDILCEVLRPKPLPEDDLFNTDADRFFPQRRERVVLGGPCRLGFERHAPLGARLGARSRSMSRRRCEHNGWY